MVIGTSLSTWCCESSITLLFRVKRWICCHECIIRSFGIELYFWGGYGWFVLARFQLILVGRLSPSSDSGILSRLTWFMVMFRALPSPPAPRLRHHLIGQRPRCTFCKAVLGISAILHFLLRFGHVSSFQIDIRNAD